MPCRILRKHPATKRNRKPSRHSKSRGGATAVEFALVAPLVFMILFGALELGHANMVFHSAEAAAYEGARKGIVPGATAADCSASANDLLNLCGVRGATISVFPPNLSASDRSVTVRVVVPYVNNAITVPVFTRNLTISRECKLTRERSN